MGILIAGMAGTCQTKDSIYLYNGQLLIGKVQSATLGSISIDDMDLKMLSIKLYKIKRMRIDQPFKIELLDNSLYFGSIEPDAKDGWIVIRTDIGKQLAMPVVNIHVLTSLTNSFWKRLNGNLAAGVSYTKSSAVGQVNLSASVGYSTKLFEYNLQASEIGSIDSSRYSRDNENVQFLAAYRLTPTWFLPGVIQYQRNLELSIARRYLQTLGAGNKLFVKDTWQLYAISGLSFSEERSTSGVSSSLQLEVPVMLLFTFYKFHNPDIQIKSSQTTYISLSEKGRVRYDGNTSFSWQIIRYFYFSIDPYMSYDSKPPSESSSKFDYGIVVNLSYKF
jgi:hypothetical protein